MASGLLGLTRNRKRLEAIVGTLARYGLGGWLPESAPRALRDHFRGPGGESVSELSEARRIRLAVTELGTTFIKLGQMLSTRTDLIDPAVAEELSVLQARAPAEPPQAVRETIEAELGRPPAELFSSFEEECLASGSIGQVHAAETSRGEAVVVKVLHAGVEETVAEDLEILGRLAQVASTHPELGLFRPVEVVEEFRRTLLRELDLSRERRNLEQFARAFEDDPTVRFPRPFPELSSRRVLTMERFDGLGVADDERLSDEGVDTREIARRSASLWLEMIFRDGFYHADPHPGNILVLPGDVVGLLDCGMVGRLDEETRGLVEDLVLSAVKRDSAAVADVVVRLGQAPQGLDREALRRDLHEVLAEHVGASLAELKLSDLLLAILDIVRHHRVALQPSVALLVKVLVTLEGTSLHLDREVNLASLLEPYYAKALERRFAPQALLARFQRAYRDWERLVDVLPRETVDILQRLRAGTFDVHLEHRKLETTVNRLVYGLLTAALVLASSQLLSRQVPPMVGDVSVLGAATAVAGVALGARLLRAVGRSGGL